MRQKSMNVAVALATMLAIVGCDSSIDIGGLNLPTVPGTPGPSVTEVREIAGVRGVALEAVGLVEIELPGTETLTITAPESVMPLLTSEVVEGRLILGRDSPSYQGRASDIRYDISLRQLDELRLYGVGEIRARGIEADRLVVEAAGVGEIRPQGRVDRQELTVSGVGGYYALGLRSRVARVHMTSGKVQIWATDRIEGFVAPGCRVEYLGDPVIEVEGGGNVSRVPTNF